MNARPKRDSPWKCLSIRQPYAWAVIKGAKDVENRDWRYNYQGRLYIHASLKEEAERIDEVVARVAKHLGIPVARALADYHRHVEKSRGAIFGSVTMFGCAVSFDSEWFHGPFGFLFRDPRPLKKPIPAKGRPRIFEFKP